MSTDELHESNKRIKMNQDSLPGMIKVNLSKIKCHAPLSKVDLSLFPPPLSMNFQLVTSYSYQIKLSIGFEFYITINPTFLPFPYKKVEIF